MISLQYHYFGEAQFYTDTMQIPVIEAHLRLVGGICIFEWVEFLKKLIRTSGILTINHFQFTLKCKLNHFHIANVSTGLTVIPSMESCTA